MYNKLFTKILDSSIWLESDATRLVWITMLAAMDEDGFCRFAAVENVAHRARVSKRACAAALARLEGPDEDSSNPAHDGRRLERVPGGWFVLNAAEHRNLFSRAIQREQTRVRVQRFRERNANVTERNANVTPAEARKAVTVQKNVRTVQASLNCSTSLTGVQSTSRRPSTPDPSNPAQDTVPGTSYVRSISKKKAPLTPSALADFERFWLFYPRKTAKKAAEKAWLKVNPTKELVSTILAAVEQHTPHWTDPQYIPHPATWLNQGRWQDEIQEQPAFGISKATSRNAMALKQVLDEYHETQRTLEHAPQEDKQ